MFFEQFINHCDIIPVVLGSSINALGIIRSFAKKGIYSIVVDYKCEPAFYSRFVYPIVCVDPKLNCEKFINELRDLGKKLRQYGKCGFIICTSDEFLYTAGKYQDFLKPYYLFPMSKWSTIENCTDKSKLYSIAKKLDIPYPKTIIIKSVHEIDDIITEIPFPCIVKPSVTVDFVQRLGLKAFVANTTKEMVKIKKTLLKSGLINETLIIQEIIPGNIEDLYTISAYSDKNYDILAYSTGHKIRQFPPEAGTITSGRVKNVKELYELAQKIIKGLQFHGISNIEFKRDSRNGVYKLIEINPRPGLWIYSATASGVNLPYVAYADLVFNYKTPVLYTDNEVIWIYDFKDFIGAVFLNNFMGNGDYTVSIREWFQSLRGKRVYAIWDSKDPKPFAAFLKNSMEKIIKRLVPNYRNDEAGIKAK